VPTLDPVSVTLRQGQFTLLHQARNAACRVTITATSDADAGGAHFRIKRRLGLRANEFDGSQAFLSLIQTLLGATVEATAPAGLATLEVTYVVKTGADAAAP
jgi:hypothetical protein